MIRSSAEDEVFAGLFVYLALVTYEKSNLSSLSPVVFLNILVNKTIKDNAALPGKERPNCRSKSVTYIYNLQAFVP